jgi:hypothetical protein
MTTSNKVYDKLSEDIRNYGWHVIKVLAEGEEPPFGYSIGLVETFGHPEIIIVGLKLDLIHSLINSIGEFVRGGLKYTAGSFNSDILDGYDCYLTSVSDAHYDNFFGTAQGYYRNNNFPVLQCIYPTTKGVFPWERKWPIELKGLQPILGDIPERNKPRS